MPSGDEYRSKTDEFVAKAEAETDQSIVFELQTLARSYLRLAEHADRKDRSPIIVARPLIRCRQLSKSHSQKILKILAKPETFFRLAG
jgi:hypothetical protein